jgi:hypothetical protein
MNLWRRIYGMCTVDDDLLACAGEYQDAGGSKTGRYDCERYAVTNNSWTVEQLPLRVQVPYAECVTLHGRPFLFARHWNSGAVYMLGSRDVI